MGTATCRAFAKILEVLYHVSFTFSDKLLSIHITLNGTEFPQVLHCFILEPPRKEIKMNALSHKLLKLGTINRSEMFQHRYDLNLVYSI